MKLIALDSSGSVATVAIASEERLLAEYSLDNGMTHSQTMLPMLDEITKLSGISLEEIDAVAVAGGPGSFTGLRIGSATAKGIALALRKPVISVPTLEGLAYNVYGSPYLVCPMMNARREQAYTALYRFVPWETELSLSVLEDQTAEDVRTWCKKINGYGEDVLLLGDGAQDFRDMLQEELQVPCHFAPMHLNRPKAGSLAQRAIQYYKMGRIQQGRMHRPVYLRASQAERERAQRQQETQPEKG